MAQSYFGAGAGQSGSVQSLGGAIAGLDSSNRDKYEVEYYAPGLRKRASGYVKLFDPEIITGAYNEYNNLYRANDGKAAENAGFYDNLARGILSDGTRTADTYERMRDGNLASLGNVFKSVLDHGLASQKARLAAGGFGGSGPSSYDRILSSTMSASNLTPVLNTIYGNLGRDATAAVGGDRAWDSYRMSQFAQDPLTGYYDSVAQRAINPLSTYRGLINQDIGAMGNLLQNVIIPNVAGYNLMPGLGSKLNNVAAGVMNLANFGTSMYGNFAGGGMGGMMGGMGGMGGGGGAPTTTANGYPNSVSYSVPVQYAQPVGGYGGYGVGYGQPVTVNPNVPATTNSFNPYAGNYYAGLSL